MSHQVQSVSMAERDICDEDIYQSLCRHSRSASHDQFVLTKVLGLTNISKNALDCNQVTGYVAFPASCMLVLLDPKTNEQKFIESSTSKHISCVCFSDDGRLVAFGEAGLKPYVSVWTMRDHKESSKFLVDHSVGVKTIAFHPKACYLVVIGVQDLNIGVWDYNKCQKLALTKWQTIPLSMTIPKSGSNVILCGHRKITLLNLDNINSNSYETNVFEDKKAVLLGRQSEYTFVDITSGRGKFDKNVYTVTTCGYLCEIRLGDILIDKAIKVDTHAFCVRYALNHVFVGCREGVVKICDPDTLNIAAAISLEQLIGFQAFPQATSKLYLDTMAIAVNEKDSVVTCIYANCSIHSWHVTGLNDVIECSVLMPPQSAEELNEFELDTIAKENARKGSRFRAFVGCLDVSKGSRLLDTETLAARNGMRCHHNLINTIKDGTAKNQQVTAFRFSPDDRDVICGNEAGEIKVYNASSGALRRVIEAHSSQVTCIELMYDDEHQLVCSGGRDRVIFILNAKTNFSLVQVLCDHSAAITSISLMKSGGILTLVSAAADNLILVRRAVPGKTLKFTVTGQIVESRCNRTLNVSCDYIITGDKNGNIKLFKADPVFNPKSSKTLKSLPRTGQATSIQRPMCMDPTGSFIATAQNSGQIVVYHIQTGQPIASLSGQIDATAIRFTNSLKYMVSSTYNGCTMIWRLPLRMTQLLESKRSKSYQIEVAKEISFQATFVKMCKKTTVTDSDAHLTYSSSDSNHHYDARTTPSIESLSFLQVRHKNEGERDRRSASGSFSNVSCSTCTDTGLDTVHWCPSSGSSLDSSSGLNRLLFKNNINVFGKIIDDTTCRRVGAFEKKMNGVYSKSKVKSGDSAVDLTKSARDRNFLEHQKKNTEHLTTTVSPRPQSDNVKDVEEGMEAVLNDFLAETKKDETSCLGDKGLLRAINDIIRKDTNFAKSGEGSSTTAAEGKMKNKISNGLDKVKNEKQGENKARDRDRNLEKSALLQLFHLLPTSTDQAPPVRSTSPDCQHVSPDGSHRQSEVSASTSPCRWSLPSQISTWLTGSLRSTSPPDQNSASLRPGTGTSPAPFSGSCCDDTGARTLSSSRKDSGDGEDDKHQRSSDQIDKTGNLSDSPNCCEGQNVSNSPKVQPATNLAPALSTILPEILARESLLDDSLLNEISQVCRNEMTRQSAHETCRKESPEKLSFEGELLSSDRKMSVTKDSQGSTPDGRLRRTNTVESFTARSGIMVFTKTRTEEAASTSRGSSMINSTDTQNDSAQEKLPFFDKTKQ